MVMAVFVCLFVFFRFSNILDASLIYFFLKWFSLFFLPLKLWSLPAFWLLKKIFIYFLITTTACQTFLQCLSWLMLKTNCVPSSIWCCSDFLAWNCDSMFTPLSHFSFLLTMMLFFAVQNSRPEHTWSVCSLPLQLVWFQVVWLRWDGPVSLSAWGHRTQMRPLCSRIFQLPGGRLHT